MELSLSQLEAKHLELKNYLAIGKYAEFFLQAGDLPFCNGIARYKKEYLDNHFPHGLPHFGQQLEVFIADCFAHEKKRLQTQVQTEPKEENRPQTEQKSTVTPEQERAADMWFKRGTEIIDKEAKIAALSQAIALKPDYVEAYFERGCAKYDLKRHEEAIEDFDKTVALDTDFKRVYFLRGLAKYFLEKYKEAIEDFNQAIAFNIEDGGYFYRRALAYSMLKDKQGVLNSLCSAIRKEDYWKADAKTDTDFAWLWDDTSFKKLVE